MDNNEIKRERNHLQAQSDLIEAVEESVGFNSDIYDGNESEVEALNDLLCAITNLYKERTPEMFAYLAKAIRQFR